MGVGEEYVPNNAPSRKFLDPLKRATGVVSLPLLYKERKSLHTKTCQRMGGPKRVFGRGVIREVFFPPVFPKSVVSKRVGLADVPQYRKPVTRAQKRSDGRQNCPFTNRPSLTLIFFSLLFWEKTRKNTTKKRLLSLPNPQILWKCSKQQGIS